MTDGPLDRRWAPITIPASWVYGSIMRGRNAGFGRWRPIRRLPVPVVSIGNLSVGGTGKSPMVHWMVRTLIAGGHRPAVCLRGYGAAPGTDPRDADEAREHREALPGTPVVADPRRAAAMRAALGDDPDIDAVVVDDGFQHRQLGRDLDVVLLDATASPFDDRVLPAGWLREPIAGLRRADVIVVTRATRVDSSLVARLEDLGAPIPLAWVNHRWTGIRRHGGPGDEPGRDAAAAAGTGATEATGGATSAASSAPAGSTVVPVDRLAGRRLAIMAGVGRPESVVAAAERAGATVVHVEPVRDHQRYEVAGVRAAFDRARERGADGVLVTRKDRVKLDAPEFADVRSAGPPLLEPVLGLEFVAGEAELAGRLRTAVATARDRHAEARRGPTAG